MTQFLAAYMCVALCFSIAGGVDKGFRVTILGLTVYGLLYDEIRLHQSNGIFQALIFSPHSRHPMAWVSRKQSLDVRFVESAATYTFCSRVQARSEWGFLVYLPARFALEIVPK